MENVKYKRKVRETHNGSIVVTYNIQKANCCNCNRAIIRKGKILRDYNYNPMEFAGDFKKTNYSKGLWCINCKNQLEQVFMELGYLKYRGMKKLKSQQ